MRPAILALAAAAFTLPAAAADPPAGKKVRIVMVGDSTMASYPKPPADRPDLTGWGQVFGEYFTDRVEVVNHAASGRSSGSFVREGRWAKALADKPDYVFVQFGHNDQKVKDGTGDPETGFRDNLRRYVAEATKAGAKAVLVTPVARRTFQGGKPHTTLTPYADATKAVAKEQDVPVIDLHGLSLALYGKLGDDGSADLSPSQADRTHFSKKGATAMAKLVAGEIATTVPDLKPYLKPAAGKP